jgi:hypothetical protein
LETIFGNKGVEIVCTVAISSILSIPGERVIAASSTVNTNNMDSCGGGAGGSLGIHILFKTTMEAIGGV